MDAPWVVDEGMIASLGIKTVAHGTFHDESSQASAKDEYKYPRRKGMLRELSSSRQLSVSEIVQRINSNRDRYARKFELKKQQEDTYYDQRYAKTGAA